MPAPLPSGSDGFTAAARPQVAAGQELVLQFLISFSGERWEETSNPHPHLLKVCYR